MRKYVLSVFIFAILLTACASESNDVTDDEVTANVDVNLPGTTESPPPELASQEVDTDFMFPDYLDGLEFFEMIRENPAVMLQLTPVNPGEELIVLHTNFGDITLRFFPEEAPLAVENFVTHARNGFYDGVIFHRVIPGFMIQGGDPEGTGMGGSSIWGEPFFVEPSLNLRHFRGALAMAHAGGRMGSQFYIVQNNGLDFERIMEFDEMYFFHNLVLGEFSDGTQITWGHIHPRDGLRYFIENGGTPQLDWFWNDFPGGPHTVFGHVVDGMDVVDAIANTPRGINDRPNDDVVIERVSFIIYGG